MSHTRLNRIIGLAVFAVTLTIYFMTMSPTVVFWDVGEFIAAASMLQVPHPPGSPLFLLVTRLAMMIPFASDMAVRAHAFSATCSALGIMFLYLVIVRVVINFRGVPETVVDRIIVYGSGVIGALSLAFGTSYWDNSLEAEVYGASMLFLSSIMWLVLRWRERSDRPGNEKYILFIAYLIGLSLGVHLLALLAIFPVLMIIYFRKYEFSFGSFILFGLIASGIFFVVYPGIVKHVPDMLDGTFQGTKSEFIKWVPYLLLGFAAYGVYTSYVRKQKLLHIGLLSILLIFAGYSTYTSVLIRSKANPPMNENDPSNLARLTSYLGRDQYGNAPLFLPRRYSNEPHQQRMYSQYSSDTDFLIRYQLNHMFFRYLGWNYIGQAGEQQDDGVRWQDTLAIPFLVGLFGLYYQFKKDWKMGVVFLAAFIILGPVLALYQNQQEPQPRERDYFYVGAFFVFSLWIAVGVVGIVDLLRDWLKQERLALPLSGGVVGILAVVIPVNMVRINYHEKDRTGNYVAWDYSYNILQTCEKDAILFTNGDNDTFPLWYLQDVEGIRRDVRIVNLSLVNTPWYIKQMKAKPYYAEAKAVPISIPEAQIETIAPTVFQPRQLSLPVPPDVLRQFDVTDTSIVNNGRIDFTMNNTLEFSGTKAIRVQDIMVRDIVFTNRWQRPIYFAVTVAPDSKIGLDEFLWFDGLAWRLEPRRISNANLGMEPDVVEQNLMDEPKDFYTTPHYGYKFRNVADPTVHFDENTTRLMINYRSAFMRLAEYYASGIHDTTKSVAALDRMETLIPRSKIVMGWDVAYIVGSFYRRLGRLDKYDEYAADVLSQAEAAISNGNINASSPSGYSAAAILLEMYEGRGDYQKLVHLWQEIAQAYPNDPSVRQRLAAAEAKLKSTTLPSDHDSSRTN